MADEVLLRASGVEITPKIARFFNTSYQVANIGSVTVHVQRKMNSFAAFLLVMALVAVVGGFNAQSNNLDYAIWVFVAAAACIIGAIVVQNIWPKRISTLILKTSSGDIQALVSQDGAHVASVQQALEEAFIRRT
jgi:hypothetical protein